mgnify:CR=1 FL=1
MVISRNGFTERVLGEWRSEHDERYDLWAKQIRAVYEPHDKGMVPWPKHSITWDEMTRRSKTPSSSHMFALSAFWLIPLKAMLLLPPPQTLIVAGIWVVITLIGIAARFTAWRDAMLTCAFCEKKIWFDGRHNPAHDCSKYMNRLWYAKHRWCFEKASTCPWCEQPLVKMEMGRYAQGHCLLKVEA